MVTITTIIAHRTPNAVLEYLVKFIPVVIPLAIAVVGWISSRYQRRNVLRSSFLAQTNSLLKTVCEEKNFVDRKDVDRTWFPVLPYFRGADAPLSAAGLLTGPEVQSLVYLLFVYRERIAYIAAYSSLRQTIEGVDDALGVDISITSQIAEIYKTDLNHIETAAIDAQKLLQLNRGFLGFLHRISGGRYNHSSRPKTKTK